VTAGFTPPQPNIRMPGLRITSPSSVQFVQFAPNNCRSLSKVRKLVWTCERSWQTYPSLHSAFTTPDNPVKIVANQHECGASCSIWISPSITQAVLRPSANPGYECPRPFVPAYSPVIPSKPALKNRAGRQRAGCRQELYIP